MPESPLNISAAYSDVIRKREDAGMQRYLLSNGDIASARASAEEFLAKNKIEHAEAIRLCMMVEEVLLDYQRRFGEDREFTMKLGKIFRRNEIIVQLNGERLDPFEEEDPDLELLHRLRNLSDSSTGWSYKNGTNIVSFVPKRKKKLPTSARTLIAVLLGVAAALLCGLISEGPRQVLLDDYVSPTLSTIMGVITAVSGPMIFFSLVWGICTIGDTNTLSKIGKKMIFRFLIELLLVSAFSALICWPLFTGSSGNSAAFNLSEFYQMILGIVPNNMLTPFTNGNTQQIIFLAIVSGVVLLILGSRVSAVTNLVDHMTTLVQSLMSMANVLIPFMVFLSVFKLVLGGQLTAVSQSFKIVPIYIGISLLILLVYTAIVAVKHRVNPFLLMKKSGPAFLLALTTASSPAALSANLDVCEHRFGIDSRIVRFGVPLGQTLFKPGSLSRFVAVSFCMAEIYGVAITPNWLTLVILTCFLMGVSSPPVAGGAVVCFAILFRQLGIPEEAIGFALTLNVLFDFILTAVNIYCLQMELTTLSGKLNMLDEETLRKSA